jgi:hypothetical protein
MTESLRSLTGRRPAIISPNYTYPEAITTVAHWPTTENRPVPFEKLSPRLKGMGTQVVYISPDKQLFHLAGPNAGREGVSLATQLLGDQQWPFDVVVQESAYMMGASIERVNINKRMFNLGVIIGRHNPPMTEYQYRMAEDNWWQSQDEQQDGWLGIWTRFSGWRWIPVRPDKTVQTAQKMDNVAFGNNVSTWDITWIAARPYFTKPALYSTWKAKLAPGTATSEPIMAPTQPNPIAGGPDLYTGTINLANRGDLPSYVSFLVSSPGEAWVQDNDSERMVKLPYTAKTDGIYLCDTEPGHRTLTAAKDPVDNLLYDVIRQSKILDFFLHDTGALGLPLQLRFNDRFMYRVPPKTSVALTVQHSKANGTITAFLPQRHKRSR